MIEVYERTKSILNKDQARLPIGFMPCLTADIAGVLEGYMDIKACDINIGMEFLEGGKYEIRIKAIGERVKSKLSNK